jgi:KipI family sensor histidine kinase inhibitor
MGSKTLESFKYSWYSENSVIVKIPTQYTPNSVKSFLKPFFKESKIIVGLDSVVVQNKKYDVELRHELKLVLEQYSPETEEYFQDQRDSSFIKIAIEYNGEDLSRVSKLLNTPETDLIKAHKETLWEVALLGFVPGFGYLLPSHSPVDYWSQIPRLNTPREKVEQGSVAVAAGMCAIYPNSMPGGWAILGKTEAKLFDPKNIDSPTLYKAGDHIKFVQKNGGDGASEQS